MLCVCRVLLAVIGISYLVCVLFLSGVQKEDLEVSLLKKLQHYNIDFDKNNEQLRAECLNHSSVDPDAADRDRNITDKPDITTTSTTIAPPNGVALDTTELNSVLKLLKHKKKCRNPNTTQTSKSPETSDEAKSLENLENINRVYEKLKNENDGNVQKDHDSVAMNFSKEISTEDMNKYLKTGILFANTTGSKNSTKTGDNVTNGINNKDVDISEFNTIAKIEKMLAEYLSKKKLVYTTTPKEIPNSTEAPQIKNVYEIEQKFVSGIDAINKLNENIAILQKNIDGVKILNSNISVPSKESGTKIENATIKLIKKGEVSESNLTNILTTVSDNSHTVNTETTQYAPMLTNTNSNMKYSPVKYATQVNNTLNIFGPGNVKESYIESHLMDSQIPLLEEDSQIPYNANKLDTFALWNKYYSQNIPEYLHSSINRQLNLDIAQQGLKKVTNYNYKKNQIAHNSNAIKIQKNYQNHISMPYMTDPHFFEDLTKSGFNDRQPENLMQPVQVDGLRNLNNGYLQDKDFYSFNTDNIVPEEIKLPTHLDYTHFFKKFPKQFPLYQTRVEQATHSAYNILEEPQANMDVKNAPEVLKDDKHPHSLPTQNMNIAEHENQNGENLQNSNYFFNNNSIFNKSSDTQENQNSLSFDTISKIAESVKAIVLKDLKKDTATSTKTVTSTTTTIPSTTTSMPLTIETKHITIVTSIPTTVTIVSSTTSPPGTPKEQFYYAKNSNGSNDKMQTDDIKVQDASQVLEKFIQMFQEIKSLQDKTVKYSKKKQSTKTMTKQILKVPVPLPNLNPFGVRVPPSPVVLYNYITPTINGPPFSPNFMTKVDGKSSMSRVPTPINFVPHPFPDAVLIQSNLHEIQPLGVPVAKPEAINMNIVVTTEDPWDRQERDQRNYMYKHSRSPEKEKDIESMKNTFDVYSNNKIVSNVPACQNYKNNSSDAVDRNGVTLQGSQHNISSHSHFNEYVSKIAKLQENTINYSHNLCSDENLKNPFQNVPTECINEETISGPKPSSPNLNEGNILASNNNNLNPVLGSPTGKVNVILMKDINDYFKPHQTKQIIKLNLKNGNKEAMNLRPTLDNRHQETRSGGEKSENSNAKTTFSKLEKYFDSPSSIESLGKKEYIRPTFKNPKFSSDFSSSETTSPSDEDSNRDQRSRQFRPYRGIKSNNRGEGNMKQRTDTTKIDLIKELFERYNKHKGKGRSDDDSLKYKSLIEYNTKVQKPHDSSDTYGSKVRGFHKKLEGSNSWPASKIDCGTDENCKSSAKILSRDQIPVTSKKVSKYDDTRFKNFLKTQQKVNRMLEIILATKTAQIDSTETKASYI